MLKEAAALIKHGVPWDVAMNMSRGTRWAFLVIFGELNGNRFNWDAMQWVENNDG